MGEYVELAGVKTWYDFVGTGDPLVLMHGGMVTNDTWSEVMPVLAERFRVYAPERRAHGHTPDVEGALHYADMATDTIEFIDTVVKQPAHLVGWSDGGNVGLLVAIARPDLVRKLVAISANLNPEATLPEAHVMFDVAPDDPELEMFRSLHAASSPDGPEHWPVFWAKFGEMVSAEPDIAPSELAKITAPTLVVASDDDMFALEHPLEIYRAIPNSQLAILPGTSHALVFEKPALLNQLVLEFLEHDPPPTMLPFRRAPQ
jgi:pimeloyl-ACP methyl ester carboxylesterase